MKETFTKEELSTLQADIDRDRLDRYVQAVASGWYGASEKSAEGTNAYGDNPRLEPIELLAPIIVDVAMGLMNRVDEVLACEHEESSLHEELTATLDPPLETPPTK